MSAAALGYDSVIHQDGKDWFAAPADGRRFLSLGVDVVKPDDAPPNPSSSAYHGGAAEGGEDRWLAVTSGRMRAWGLNTVGSWSHPPMDGRGFAHVGQLHLAPWSPHRLVDVWDSSYAAAIERAADEQMRGRDPRDPSLLGWFLDNELPWFGEAGWRTGDPRTLRDRYLELTATAPGRAVAERVADADAFAGEVAARFMALAVAAVRRRDPNHLILGVRVAGDAPDPVIRAIGAATDVFSLNWYVKDGRPDPAHLDRIWTLARKPVLLSEFSYRAMENRSGCGNTHGADVTVATQAERAVRYRRYVETLVRLPYVVGFHWFMWFDEPTLGRFDGEDSNYGLVDHRDRPYEPLVKAMTAFNAAAERLHAASDWRNPGEPGPAHARAALEVTGLPAGRRFAPFVWDDWADARGSRTQTGQLWGDGRSACAGAVEVREGAAAWTFHAGPGWGCGISFPAPGGSPADVAGARSLVFDADVPSGTRLDVIVTESGAGPRSATSFPGARGADGEEYALALTGAGTTTYAVPLASLNGGGGYGNPAGNGRLDTQAIDRISLRVDGGQGDGVIRVRRIAFR